MTVNEECPGRKRDQLAGFHRTISEQLNARLSESPRFFWALVVVSTGYGYVLWNVANDQRQAEPGLNVMLSIASLLSYGAVLWASWYLAALGYAFRYLQNVQHCIEQALGWGDVFGPRRGNPPSRIRWCSLDHFWLLPGIYHAHVSGLVLFLTIVIIAFYWFNRQCWCSYQALCIGIIAFVSWAIGVVFIVGINRHYVVKYRKKRKDPASVTVLHDD